MTDELKHRRMLDVMQSENHNAGKILMLSRFTINYGFLYELMYYTTSKFL